MRSHSLVAFRETQNTDPSQSPGFCLHFQFLFSPPQTGQNTSEYRQFDVLGGKKSAPANPSVLWLIGIGYCTSTSAEALGLSWGVLFSVSQDEQLERGSHETRGR